MAKGATTNKLDVEVRTRTGKGASRLARREGKVPAVLYGHGAEPVARTALAAGADGVDDHPFDGIESQVVRHQGAIGRHEALQARPLRDGRCLCGVCVLDTITRVSDAVRYTPRRRKLLVFVGTGAVLQVGALKSYAPIGRASLASSSATT